MTGPQVFRVALDMPLRRLFDYLAPQGPGLSGPGGAASPGSGGTSVRAAPAAARSGPAAGPSAVADLSDAVDPGPVADLSAAVDLSAAADPGPAAMAPPSAITRPIQPGTRVRVPFGRQRLVGVEIGRAHV